MRFIALLIFVTLPFIGYNQEIVFNEKIRLNYELKDLREAYSIVDSANRSMAFFLIDNTKINGFLLDNQLNISSKTILPKDKKNKYIVGHTTSGNTYNLFFSDTKSKNISISSINIKENKIKSIESDFKIKKEKVLERFSVNNMFYVLTVKTFTNKLFLYEFKEDNSFSKHEIDLSSEFSKDAPTLSYILTSPSGVSNFASDLVKMDQDGPNSLGITMFKKKLYISKEKIHITLDHSKIIDLITINLNDYSYDLKTISKGKGKDYHRSLKIVTSNSYLYKDLLFQILGFKTEIYLSVYDLKSDSIIYEYDVQKEEPITINNSEILKKKNYSFVSTEKFREIETTEDLLKNILEKGICISVFKPDSLLMVTIGSGSSVTGSTTLRQALTPITGDTAMTTYISAYSNVSFNPSVFNYFSFKNISDGNLYFNSLFETNKFKHVKGEIPENVYDKLLKYSDKIEDPISVETIFRRGQTYILGYYHLNEHVYYLVKFDENK